MMRVLPLSSQDLVQLLSFPQAKSVLDRFGTNRNSMILHNEI